MLRPGGTNTDATGDSSHNGATQCSCQTWRLLHLRIVSDLAAEVTRLCGDGRLKRFELAALTGEAPLPLQGDISKQC